MNSYMLGVVFSATAVVACARATLPPEISSTPRPADQVSVDDAGFRFEADLNRDFMPGLYPGPDTRLVALLKVVPLQSKPTTIELVSDSATFVSGSNVWRVAPRQEYSDPEYLAVIARKGPLWPVGSLVDVTFWAHDSSGKKYVFRALRRPITRSD